MCRKVFNLLASLIGRVPIETCEGIVYLTESEVTDRNDLLTLLSRDDISHVVPAKKDRVWLNFKRIKSFGIWLNIYALYDNTICIVGESCLHTIKEIPLKNVPEIKRFLELESITLSNAARLP